MLVVWAFEFIQREPTPELFPPIQEVIAPPPPEHVYRIVKQEPTQSDLPASFFSLSTTIQLFDFHMLH